MTFDCSPLSDAVPRLYQLTAPQKRVKHSQSIQVTKQDGDVAEEMQRDSVRSRKMKCSGKVFSKASPKCTTPWATWLAGQLSLPVHHIQQPGQWPHASKCVALVNPLASFLEAPLHCSSIKTRWRVRRGSAGVCWVGHMQNIPPMTDQAPTWSCF